LPRLQEIRVEELLVVGLDLASGREVTVVDELDVPRWRRRGYGGDGTLVCLHCYDGSEGNRRLVPLVARGRVAGLRRAHFAHPPGMAPGPGEHHPESLWHGVGKQRLAAWARRQPGVSGAVVEAWTVDGRRRSDVRVCFDDGREVAFELQYNSMSDAQWLGRHADYQRLGIVDVWLWHLRVGVPGIVHHHGLPGWLLDDGLDVIYALIAVGHREVEKWWEREDAADFFPHWPAHPRDDTRQRAISPDELELSANGLSLPAALISALNARAATGTTNAKLAAQAQAQATPQQQPAPRLATPLVSATAIAREAARTAVVRVDAQPSGSDVIERRRYLCVACNTGFGESDLGTHRACMRP
jgi:hypothetical protein